MRHRHTNNRHTFGMLLNRSAAVSAQAHAQTQATAAAAHIDTTQCIPVETAKRRHALMHGVPSSYWRLRHHHGYVMSRPM